MKYIKEFDSLRAFAVIAVMVQHFFGQYPSLSVLGSAGVTLFFVLSGYLITQILIIEKDSFDIDLRTNTGKIGIVLKTFYIRRSLRIFPIYYLTLLVLLVLSIDSARDYFFYHFFYASNFLYSFKTELDGLAHFWSLAVEEQFYLIWPIMILLVPSRMLGIRFFSFLIFLSLTFKVLLLKMHPESPAWYLLMPSCIESFAFGAIVILMQKREIRLGAIWAITAAALLIFLADEFLIIKHSSSASIVFMGEVLSRTFFSLFSAGVLLSLIKNIQAGRSSWLLNNRYLVLTGKISYGIYVYHHFVPDIINYLQASSGISLVGTGLQMALNFILSFVIAYLSFRFIETPINKLKSRFTYHK